MTHASKPAKTGLAHELHSLQSRCWPAEGEHVLAHFDNDTIVVYQAYRESTGRHAIARGQLGGPDFSFNRMSWIKPNFLWMMYRSGWGTKPGQEITLGLRIRRPFFDRLLRKAVESSSRPRCSPRRRTGSVSSPIPTCCCSGIRITPPMARSWRVARRNWACAAMR